ncbi:MAG TPA: efflux RND transporter periplasmic adaptor subunit [Verrucomicrobiae bacterium]|nr:efflux RND transporter periplasmic adaptor subunit [Verrucomicrobiae bacterium]
MSTSSSRWGGRLLLALVVVGAVLAGLWFWKRPREAAVEYQTAAVTRGDVVQVVTATGQLNPVTNVTVGSQISGIIQKLGADFNTRVKSGDVIAQLDPATYQANVASAQGDLANANASLELAQVNFRRSDELFKSHLISQSDYDNAVASLHQAQAQVQIKEAALQRAKVDLSRCTIYAPVDGIVISRSVDVGQTVAASLSAPTLFVIANDLSKMQIDANVAEADVGGVEVGQDVDFTVDAFPYRTFHGKVTQVRNAPTTVQNVVTYDAVIGVDNADLKLKPGMTANVSIIIARRENALKIPNSALRFRLPETGGGGRTNGMAMAPAAGGRGAGGAGAAGAASAGHGRGKGEHTGRRTIYVLPVAGAGHEESVKPVAVQIKTGIGDGIYTEVVEGLKEGDEVVTGSSAPSAARANGANPFGMQRRRF